MVVGVALDLVILVHGTDAQLWNGVHLELGLVQVPEKGECGGYETEHVDDVIGNRGFYSSHAADVLPNVLPGRDQNCADQERRPIVKFKRQIVNRNELRPEFQVRGSKKFATSLLYDLRHLLFSFCGYFNKIDSGNYRHLSL